MSLIDHTYFNGKLNLPQVAETEGRNIVNSFITLYENELLQKTLCLDLWKEFSDGIAGSGTPVEKWAKLLTGEYFDYGGRKHYWVGFQNTDLKRSPIANYVYYKFMEHKVTDNTLVGVVSPQTTNAVRVDPVKKMVDAWNEMVDMLTELKLYLNLNPEVYPEYKTCNCCEVYDRLNLLGI